MIKVTFLSILTHIFPMRSGQTTNITIGEPKITFSKDQGRKVISDVLLESSGPSSLSHYLHVQEKRQLIGTFFLRPKYIGRYIVVIHIISFGQCESFVCNNLDIITLELDS